MLHRRKGALIFLLSKLYRDHIKINKLSVLRLLKNIMCKDLAVLILVSFSFSVTENLIYILEIFGKTFNFSLKGELQYFLSFSKSLLVCLTRSRILLPWAKLENA